MSGLRTLVTAVGFVAAVGLGFGTWNWISPEERQKEITKRLPESQPEKMAEARKRNALVIQALKEAAEPSDTAQASKSQN